MGTILAVDDDPAILRLVEYTLRRAGHDVISTSDPAGALDLAGSLGVQAVVLDVMMPGIDGHEVLRRLRAQPTTAGLPVLMLSALGRGEQRVAGLRAGADDYLVKPFEPDELAIRIGRLVERSAEPVGELSGRLGVVSFAEILQFLLSSGADGALQVTSDAAQGEVVLGDGAARSAHFGGLRGSDAVLAMLELSNARFSFRQSGTRLADEDEVRGLQQLVLTSAWLADELGRRPVTPPAARLWPAFHDQGPPTIPEGFETLPFFSVWRRVLDRPGLPLADLEATLGCEPRLVRLTVSVLLEIGALRTGDEPVTLAEGPVAEAGSLERTVRTLRAGLGRGPGDPALPSILIAIQQDLQAEMLELRQGLDRALVVADDGPLTLAWRSGRVGSVTLGRDPELITVDVASLDAAVVRDRLEGVVDSYDAVIAWTRDLMLSAGLRWLVDRLKHRSGGPPAFLLVDPASRGVATTLLDGTPGWRVVDRWPVSFVELLQTLVDS